MRESMASTIPLRPRSALILALASLAGLVMFLWPLMVKVDPQQPQLMPPSSSCCSCPSWSCSVWWSWPRVAWTQRRWRCWVS